MVLQSLSTFIIPIALVPLVVKINGLEAFGEFSANLVLIQFGASLIDLGISVTGIKQLNQGYSVLSLIISRLVVFLLLTPIALAVLDLSKSYYFILVFIPIASVFNIQFFFINRNKEKTYSIITICVRMIFALMFVFSEKTIFHYSLMYVLNECSIVLLTWLLSKVTLGKVALLKVREILWINSGYVIYNNASYSYTSFPVLFLKNQGDLFSAGIYASVYRISRAISNMSAPFNSILLSEEPNYPLKMSDNWRNILSDWKVRVFHAAQLGCILLLLFLGKNILKMFSILPSYYNWSFLSILLFVPIVVSFSRLISVNVLIPYKKQGLASYATLIPAVSALFFFYVIFDSIDLINMSLVVFGCEVFCFLILRSFLYCEK